MNGASEAMGSGTWSVVAVVAVALVFDMMNGFHDGCNAVSTVIYTGALKPKIAIAVSAIFNFVGPLALGVGVAATAHLVIAALFGALVWEVVTWWWALPVSSSHALVGGLLGAGIAALGMNGIVWTKVYWVFGSLLFSPVIGIVIGLVLMRISRYLWGLTHTSAAWADRIFKWLQIGSSSWVSFSHGSNDATKVMGIICIFLAARADKSMSEYGIPIWVILSAAAAMAVGTFLSVKSFRLIRTLGEKITKLHPINGFSAELGGGVVIFLASHFGLPVSTTHVITSAVTGTGLGAGVGSVSWKVFRAIMLAWAVTLPFCAIVAAITYYILNLAF
jgi:PiT family inorganic phosphate transporter